MVKNEFPNWMIDENDSSNSTSDKKVDPLAFGTSARSINTASASGTSSSQGEYTSSSKGPTTSSDADNLEGLPRIILMMRLANIGVAAALMLISLIKMAGLPSISMWVLSMYALCGALLICLLETQLKFLRVAIALNFGFLFSATLRFLYYFLLATISFTFGIFGGIVAFAIVSVAIFNAYVLFRFPSYRAVRERIAEEEDRLIEAKVSREVKRQTAKSLLAGT
jgi:hypothetical protein